MKFSVLLPTRNRLNLLTYAIETVRKQDYDNWEIIISDNCSEENIAGYVRSLNDPRIKYYRTDTFIPVTDNWNNALAKSSGDYVIMLGDDDGLMKGYFSTIKKLAKDHDNPDIINTNAFLYAYPQVIPSRPQGSLEMFPTTVKPHAKEPFFLTKPQALRLLEHSLNFKVRFGYNMQFFTVSRRFIDSLKNHGKFYQSPYPDYYASNVIMLKASRILVTPQPLVTIGISPKSFGFFYFNDIEEQGTNFLKNVPDPVLAGRLKDVLLPGTNMNTSWLLALETLRHNFDQTLKINYHRYRQLQIFAVYRSLLLKIPKADALRNELEKHIDAREKRVYGPAFKIFSFLGTVFPQPLRLFIAKIMMALLGTYGTVFLPRIPGTFNTILDVFQQVDPERLCSGRKE